MIVQKVLARSRRLKIESQKLISSLLNGSYTSVWKGSGIAFSEVRNYLVGDDTRLIDWNVTSRFDDPYVKTFEEERDKNLFIIVDGSASMTEGAGAAKIKETVEVLTAVLALATVFNNDKIGACLVTDKIERWIPLKRGIKHALMTISEMIDTQSTGTHTNLSIAIKTVNSYLKHRGICILISDFKSNTYLKELTLLSKRHEIFAIRTVSSEDIDVPSAGYFSGVDPETGESFDLFGHGSNFKHAYRDQWAHERRNWIHECRQIGVFPLEIGSQDDPLTALYHFLQKRKKRR